MVEEALRDCPEAVEAVFTTEKVQIAAGIQQILVTESVFSHMSTQTAPQGVLAILNPVRIPHTKRGHTLLLDGVADPGNMGTLLRTAEAFDFSVWITPDCADPLNPKAVQASMGAYPASQATSLVFAGFAGPGTNAFFCRSESGRRLTPDRGRSKPFSFWVRKRMAYERSGCFAPYASSYPDGRANRVLECGSGRRYPDVYRLSTKMGTIEFVRIFCFHLLPKRA